MRGRNLRGRGRGVQVLPRRASECVGGGNRLARSVRPRNGRVAICVLDELFDPAPFQVVTVGFVDLPGGGGESLEDPSEVIPFRVSLHQAR